ncbi:hypothetical protein QCA50_002787 [Cerrena zonata]|uniref:NAD-dependent epimerase/dehydratase domain-containing protein n=1 Tax=Cerrena zonata TaxID=2478898 RepID=A0AAW0GKN5_9APHY
MSQKVVVCGAGFLGSHIARAICSAKPLAEKARVVQLSARHPDRVYKTLSQTLSQDQKTRLVQPVPVDITKPETLAPAFRDASVVVSLVGILHGTPEAFERIQWRGAQNVARAAHNAGAKLVHISAIGANPESELAYERTKGLGEQAVLEACPNATVIRPSIVFGPEDDFFNRFARLSKFLPFMPVFGGGNSLFQPVYVDDISEAVEIISRDDKEIRQLVDGKIIEAGGSDVITYRQVMEIVLKYSNRWRPIISVPFGVGKMQAFFLEKLPPNLFTLTRDQVEQLKRDNIVNTNPGSGHLSFEEFLKKYAEHAPTSAHDILPTYF